MEKTKKVGIYARVSTSDKGQDLETQLIPLREYCQNRGRLVFEEYVDQMSGAKESRPGFDRIMNDANKKRFDILLVFRFDRCSRSSRQLIMTLETLKNLGIGFVSYSEAIDTTSPSGQLMFTILSAFAQFERNIIQERVRAGLYRAKSQGKILGRPIKKVDDNKIFELKQNGFSIRDIAHQVGITKSVVERVLANK